VSGASNSSEGGNESLETDNKNNMTSNVSADEEAVAEIATERKLKKRIFRVPLKVKANFLSLCNDLSWLLICRKKIEAKRI
jgi:hypoxia up-regulated 1